MAWSLPDKRENCQYLVMYNSIVRVFKRFLKRETPSILFGIHSQGIPLILRMLKGKFSLPCCLNLMLNLFEQTLWEISKSTWEVIRENILFYYGLLGGHTVTDPHGLLWPLLWFKFAQDWWLIWNYLPIVPDILTLLRGQRLEIKHPFVSDCLCITDWSTASEWADLSVSLRLPSHQN